jgi:hypothetical protein
VDQHLRVSREALEAALAPTCAVPSIGTRLPTTYVAASALDKRSGWAAGGTAPPHITVIKAVPRPGGIIPHLERILSPKP